MARNWAVAEVIDAVVPSWPPVTIAAMMATSWSELRVSPARSMMSDRKSSPPAERRSAISCSVQGVSSVAACRAAASHPGGGIEIGMGNAPRAAAHWRSRLRSAMSKAEAREMTTAGNGSKLAPTRSRLPSASALARPLVYDLRRPLIHEGRRVNDP